MRERRQRDTQTKQGGHGLLSARSGIGVRGGHALSDSGETG
jgi:hypothetical protein